MTHPGSTSASFSTPTLEMVVPSSPMWHLAADRAKRCTRGAGSEKAFRAPEASSQKIRRRALINHTTMAQRGDKR